MFMKKRHLFFLCLVLATSFEVSVNAVAQPDTLNIPKPAIKGDSILCPNSTGTLRTQKGYDSYQWYKRNYGSNKTKAVEGATTNELAVSSNETPAYFSVVVTVKNIRLQSDEKLVDGLVFLLPSVKIGGGFKNGPGYSILREGDTGVFTLTKPYNTNITWFRDGEPIPGETTNSLYVTTGGVYTVQGAPRTCPVYIVPLGIDLFEQLKKPRDSSFNFASTTSTVAAIIDQEKNAVKVYPNPARDNIKIEGLDASKITGISIVDIRGNIVLKTTTLAASLTMNIQQLVAGVYYIKLENSAIMQTIKIVKE